MGFLPLAPAHTINHLGKTFRFRHHNCVYGHSSPQSVAITEGYTHNRYINFQICFYKIFIIRTYHNIYSINFIL